MSWTPEVYIGELRPWPESVKVVRGNSGEAMRYDRSERSNNGVERSSDGVDVTVAPDDYTAKLMAEVERLEAKSDGLLKELEAEHALAEMLGLWLDDAKAENAKLRELVRGLNWCTENPDGPRVDCERCPLGVVDGEPLELMCEKMMRELGIEVTE